MGLGAMVMPGRRWREGNGKMKEGEREQPMKRRGTNMRFVNKRGTDVRAKIKIVHIQRQFHGNRL